MTTLKKSFIIAFVLTLLIVVFLPQASLAQWDELNNVAEGAGLKPEEAAGPDLLTIISNILKAILGLTGVILLILFIYGGFLWMTAGGKDEQVEKARTMIKNAVIGLAIIVFSYAIVMFVVNQLMTGLGA